MARKALNDATTRGLWAAVVSSSRTRWIDYQSVRSTRRAARDAYLSHFDPKYRAGVLERVTFRRVYIAEDTSRE